MAVAYVTQEQYNEMRAKGQPIPIGLQVPGGTVEPPVQATPAYSSKIDPATVDPLYKNAVIAMQGAGIEDVEINKFLDEQRTATEQARIELEAEAAKAKTQMEIEAAQAEAARLADEQAFTKAQAELDALAQQERDVILKQQADYEAMQKRMQEEAAAMAEQAKAEQERLAQEAAADQMRQVQAFVEAERARLPDVIPEWKDQEVMAREAKELRDWAVNQGLSEMEIESLRQASHVALLRKAMLYDKGRTKVAQAKVKPKQQPTRVIRPGSQGTQVNASSTDVKRASQRLVRSGRITDAAALLDKLI